MLQIARRDTIAAALLKINSLNLLMPQGDIRALESATDIDTVAPALHSVGWVKYAQRRWPVYCLTEELSLTTIVPAERRACAMMALGAGYIGLMCDDMTVLKNFTAQPYELPDAMRLPTTPVLQLVMHEQGIACVSNARKLTTHIEQQVLNT